MGVIVMAALLLLYIVAVGRLALVMMQSGDGVVIAMGVALAILPLLALWGMLSEILFGLRSERLLSKLEEAGDAPDDAVPVHVSGRPDRAAADAAFPRYQAEVEAQPESWQAWLRLGVAYDACGDRRRARSSVRRAIALERSSR
ncbi:hypothetical protein DF220_13180 [Salinibacterium hongtaonis]|uniref:Uncharacterized protein n=1 Tax=Homoserinimonas hongtaonis TaxID=2079791 RepID=A0A2U1SXN5_9MICO|nr:hypothetical protein C2138_04470 [Salinibacterium hongtaonis]PWB96397.1 hypothetical protein DF220_13180 [Salinibacterium hongtaonis]